MTILYDKFLILSRGNGEDGRAFWVYPNCIFCIFHAKTIERVPELPRSRPGRRWPRMEKGPTTETSKMHLDLARVITDQIEARIDNFTGAVNDALVLWLLLGDADIVT